jgi:hypothetical protein
MYAETTYFGIFAALSLSLNNGNAVLKKERNRGSRLPQKWRTTAQITADTEMTIAGSTCGTFYKIA